jgi:hypothetical protein
MEAQYIEITKSGSKLYYKDRQMTIIHREDGPAVEWYDGGKEWLINGERHREDGPAVVYSSGSKGWYLNGKELTKAQFIRQTAPEIVLTMDEIAAKLGIEVSKLKIKK